MHANHMFLFLWLNEGLFHLGGPSILYQSMKFSIECTNINSINRLNGVKENVLFSVYQQVNMGEVSVCLK